MNTRPNSAREVLRASHRSITDANARAAASIIPMLNYGGCRAEIDGDDVVFSGPTGRHALALSVSNAERVLAHWDGFVSPRGAYLRWASVRPLTADERSRPCADCGGELEAHGVATAFGIFCRGECAEGHRRKTGRGDGTAPAKHGLTVREAQARIANTGAAFRRSGKRLVGVWSRCTEPVATTDARSPMSRQEARDSLPASLPAGAQSYGDDALSALAIATQAGVAHARYGYARVEIHEGVARFYVAPKMTRGTVSDDGVRWRNARSAS
mgnify:FL=1